MSIRRSEQRQANQRKTSPTLGAVMRVTARDNMGVSSSLGSIHISPRTPKTPRTAREDDEGVELSLLQEDERRESEFEASELDDGIPDAKRKISAKDKRGMVLLCVLCELNSIVCVFFQKNLLRNRLDSGSAGMYIFAPRYQIKSSSLCIWLAGARVRYVDKTMTAE